MPVFDERELEQTRQIAWASVVLSCISIAISVIVFFLLRNH